MADYYSQSVEIKTYLVKEVVTQVINEGASLGFIYTTYTSFNVNINSAIDFIMQTNEDDLHLILVKYQDTTFTLRFTFNFSESLYISIDPPNFPWRLCTEKVHWIDNARYARLLLLLCKNLALVNFDIESDYYSASKPEEHNTISVSIDPSPMINQDQNILMLLGNLQQYSLLSITAIKNLFDQSLQTNNYFSITLDNNGYKVNLCLGVRDGTLYFNALEPLKTRVIDQKTYKDVPLYLTMVLNITAAFPIMSLASNFEDTP